MSCRFTLSSRAGALPVIRSLFLAPLAVALALGALASLFPLASARAGGTQVWVTVHAVEDTGDREVMDMRLPIEWVKDMDTVASCDEEDGQDETAIRCEEVYARFKDLKAGEEKLVAERECQDGKITVRARAEKLDSPEPARRIRILIKGDEDGERGGLDFGISLDTVEDLKNFFGLLGRDGKKDRWKDLEDNPEIARTLRALGSFEIMRVRNSEGKETMVIRTE